MPKRIKPLSSLEVEKAKPRDKEYKLSDGGGLYLLVTTSGGKLWRLQYRFNGKQKGLAFGSYPEISLADARQRREDARKLIATDIDPCEIKKDQKGREQEQKKIDSNTFEKIAREWFAKQLPVWSKGHSDTVISRLERDVFPFVGNSPISEIKTSDMLNVIIRVDSRGAIDTALRIKIICGQVFRYAVMNEMADTDVMASIKPREVLSKRDKKHFAAITEPKQLHPLLRAIDEYRGSFIVKSALRLAPLVFVRPGELRKAEWEHFDLEAAEWRYFVTKTNKQHIVPLSSQALEILKALHPVTGNSKYVFTGRALSRPMSDNTINAALRYMGFDNSLMTAHGFRAMARTILDEVLHVRIDYIEHQLAHAVKDPNGRAYNRTAHLAERKKMMQLWADYLDELKSNTR
jgi:integrase